ncbi:winged helix-turn-helix transcriptional regulator [archaeon]|nr:winged helix-turn-helix transcriptional regulator [archaeon]
MGLYRLFETPSAKILDLLITFRRFDYSLKDITEGTGVSFRTAQRVIPLLVKEGLIVKTRKEGKAQMYMINFTSGVVKKLDELAIEENLEYLGSFEKRPKRAFVAEVMKDFAPMLAR